MGISPVLWVEFSGALRWELVCLEQRGSFSRAGSVQKASIKSCRILQAESWVGVVWKVHSGGGCTFKQRGLQVSGVFRSPWVCSLGRANDSHHRPRFSLHTANVSCRVLNKGYHDDSLAAINSYFDFRKMMIGLSSVKHFSFD